MKKLVVLALFVVAGLVVYNYATTGEIGLMPSFSQSAEQRSVQDLAERFAAARKTIGQAHRTAGVSGIDTSSDVAGAQREIEGLQRDLKKLRKSLVEEKAQSAAAQLSAEIERYVKTL